MRHGDLVYIPSAEDHKVYVFGEVNDPKAVQISHGQLSLAQALAEAGGIVEVDADKSHIKLIRGSWQEPTVYTLKYDTILAHGDRILLRPGDRVVVQPTGLTTASRYMQQIMPFLVAADIGSAMYFRFSR
jgi:polysaccharide export outer membrane protein